MQILNEFVLVFLHIAVSVFELTRGCRRGRRHCEDGGCYPCNQFGGPKVRAKIGMKMRVSNIVLILLLLLALVLGCRRKRCQKYCLPCKYKGPIIEVIYPKQKNRDSQSGRYRWFPRRHFRTGIPKVVDIHGFPRDALEQGFLKWSISMVSQGTLYNSDSQSGRYQWFPREHFRTGVPN
ncbi:unnamed protein product [Euphydryas editha]|uniref:Uncharacterized protein n=1 Tax=Euphydryas editha TaxID=104508 RepID=A0AAU9UIY4_EUPED|nr:unnamed protein product [Euphydryas editha]